MSESLNISHAVILDKIDAINPVNYGKTRNYINGDVTWLSPYLTHGIINTHTVAQRLLENHTPQDCYPLLYQLAWREYFHRKWQTLGDDIFGGIYREQEGNISTALPNIILSCETGIDIIDQGLETLQTKGWMHNHLRLWLAGIICNLGNTDWKIASRWMYYYLLDGDLASNTLSWQWVSGTFSHKKYIANQDNINKYSETHQSNTWLDVSYEALAALSPPEIFTNRTATIDLPQKVPGDSVPRECINDVALHSLWNLNPNWLRNDSNASHVLFIESEQVNEWPMASHRWEFIRYWAIQLELEIWLGSVNELDRLHEQGVTFVREEYPACNHWPGQVIDREFHFNEPSKSFRSFSQFWKQVK